ncbi:MAG: trimethylamine methyltransferase family protein [Alphaproteobacteria bacterium]
MPEAAERRERGGVRARQGRGAPRDSVRQLPWRETINPYPPMEIISADQLEAIHEAGLRILEELGMRILLPEARAIYRAAGARVDDAEQMVFMDRGLVMDSLANAPPSFLLHARNPLRTRTLGERVVNFANVGGAPYVSDLDRGRRPGIFEDYCNLLKLAQSLNVVHIPAGYAPEPQDVPVAVRHMVAMKALVRLTDKALFGFSLSQQRIFDNIEMARIARGVDAATLNREPSLYTIVNTNSPRQLDRPMLWGIIEMARANQVVCVTPFTLAGAMAQQHAEAMAGLALAQIVRPGAPVIYGGFTSNVDMKSGAPAFGTPEYVKAAMIGGQLARRLNLPYRTSNTNASNAPDVQSAYEGAMSLWGAVLGGGNLIVHALGWLEGGLVANYEKYVIDAEMCQIMLSFLEPEVVDDGTLALDAMREVAPGGHYFGAAHTLARYETAFYAPMLSDWRAFQHWEADGSVDATHRANKLWKRLLADYEAPPLDPGIAEELAAFIAKRTEEGGAPIQ